MPGQHPDTGQRITGAIPAGPVSADTEIVFVAGQPFVNASKHEQVVEHHVAENERLRKSIQAHRERIRQLVEQVDALANVEETRP